MPLLFELYNESIVSADGNQRADCAIDFSKSMKGGQGSGNFGHAGRPGKVGGSGSGEYEEISSWQEFEHLKNLQAKGVHKRPTGLLDDIYTPSTDEWDPPPQEWWNALAERWGPSSPEVEAIEKHIRLSNDVNRYLRAGDEYAGKEVIEQRVKALDLAFTRPYNVSPKNLIVYRGPQLASQLDMSSFVEKGFPSTSYTHIDQFSQGGRSMKIRLPEGFPAIFASPHEREIILPRGITFTKAKDGIWDVKLPDGRKPKPFNFE